MEPKWRDQVHQMSWDTRTGLGSQVQSLSVSTSYHHTTKSFTVSPASHYSLGPWGYSHHPRIPERQTNRGSTHVGPGLPLAGSPTPLPRTLWALTSADLPLPFLTPSKQRHNKLWRQQTDSCLQQPVDDPAAPEDFLPETLDSTPEAQPPCLDDAAQPGFPGSRAPGDPALPCCFRRLSDPLLSSPSDESGGLVQLEDLEREALLEEATQPAEAYKPARHPQEGPGLCEKDGKKKLEFGSPRAWGSSSSPQVEDMEREEAPLPLPGAGRWGRPTTQLDNLLDRENLNNNNSKRSCPDDFEVGMVPLALWGSVPATSILPRGSPLCQLGGSTSESRSAGLWEVDVGGPGIPREWQSFPQPLHPSTSPSCLSQGFKVFGFFCFCLFVLGFFFFLFLVPHLGHMEVSRLGV